MRGGSRGALRIQRDFGESSQLTDNPGILLTIAAIIAVIGPLVFVHELGHYLMARLFGVQAETFSIGVGKELAAWVDKRGTRSDERRVGKECVSTCRYGVSQLPSKKKTQTGQI